MIDIDKLEQLERAATPGPWIPLQDGTICRKVRMTWLDSRRKCREWDITYGEARFHDGNAELIATIRNVLPELLAEVRRLRRIEEMASTLIDYEDANYHGEGEPWVWDAKFADLRSALCSRTE